MVDLREGVAFPPLVEGGGLTLDEDCLCYSASKPVTLPVEHGHTAFIDGVSPLLHMDTDWGRGAMVFLEAGVEASLCLSHVQLRAIVALNLVHNTRLVQPVGLVFGVDQFCPEGVGGSYVYLDPSFKFLVCFNFENFKSLTMLYIVPCLHFLCDLLSCRRNPIILF